MNYLNNDELERYWFKYKSEGEPHGMSLERFYKRLIIFAFPITHYKLLIVTGGS